MALNHKASNDRKNLEREVHERFAVQSGQSSIHGDTNYEVQTQEGQSFAFYADKGEGKSGSGGPGTGKAVLYTPGQSCEVLGEGLKVRDAGDIEPVYAKIIDCKKGDMLLQCENGDITIKARNVNLVAEGGGQDGQFMVEACRLAQITSPDVRVQGEKILISAKNSANIISKGFFQLKYGFALAAADADMSYGVMSEVLKKATTISTPSTPQ
tara:strand:- start:245 stop:880 length:636 start_codon:yes stop_codon:yes gene_type:complete